MIFSRWHLDLLITVSGLLIRQLRQQSFFSIPTGSMMLLKNLTWLVPGIFQLTPGISICKADEVTPGYGSIWLRLPWVMALFTSPSGCPKLAKTNKILPTFLSTAGCTVEILSHSTARYHRLTPLPGIFEVAPGINQVCPRHLDKVFRLSLFRLSTSGSPKKTVI